MTYFHKVSSLKDEEEILKNIINLETAVRAKQEKKRLQENADSSAYAQIFEPITSTMKSLHSIEHSHGNSSKVKSPEEHLMHFEKHANVDPYADEEEMYNLSQPPLLPYKEGSESIPRLSEILRQIPKRKRDDGMFGIDWNTQTLGGYPIAVDNDHLSVDMQDGKKHQFEIKNPGVWKLLLTQNPHSSDIVLKNNDGSDSETLEQYRNIVQTLGLVRRIQSSGKHGYLQRNKYKLLTDEHSGKGFLFSVKKPKFMEKNNAELPVKSSNTIIIPSDKKSILKTLVKALAEKRAGNSSMRNLVVALAREARAKGILPANLLSPEEMNYIQI